MDSDRLPAPRRRPRPKRTWLLLALVALAYTLVNVLKPVHIDDAAYIQYARQIAQHPDDPYGFALVWYFGPEPANNILAPPVFLYWLGLGVRLLGDHPALWKLWGYPFALLFVAGVYGLARRAARDLAWPLTLMTVASPVFLPSLNLMLDVPALGLGLAGLNAFLGALERNSWRRALLAGLLAGLAMQTKYSTVTIPGAMGLWALVRLRPWPEWFMLAAAGVVAAGVFLSWEQFTRVRYGESHFVHGYKDRQDQEFWKHKMEISGPLLAQTGSVAAGLMILALAGLRAPRRLLLFAAALAAAAYGSLAAFNVYFLIVADRSQTIFGPQDVEYIWKVRLSEVIFSALAVLICAALVGVLLALARAGTWCGRRAPGPVPAPTRRLRHRVEAWLLLWLALELAGYYFLTPFGAVRRLMGIYLVFTLLAGRLASLTCHAPPRRRLVWAAVGVSAALGAAFQYTDWIEARRQADAPALARSWIDSHRADVVPAYGDQLAAPLPAPDSATVWYSGHWGFKFYAEREGMREVILAPDRRDAVPLLQPTRLRRGDWFVVPDNRVFQAGVDRQVGRHGQRVPLVEVGHLRLPTEWPLRSVPAFYGGPVALEHAQFLTGLEMRIYRVTADFDDLRPAEGGFEPLLIED